MFGKDAGTIKGRISTFYEWIELLIREEEGLHVAGAEDFPTEFLRNVVDIHKKHYADLSKAIRESRKR